MDARNENIKDSKAKHSVRKTVHGTSQDSSTSRCEAPGEAMRTRIPVARRGLRPAYGVSGPNQGTALDSASGPQTADENNPSSMGNVRSTTTRNYVVQGSEAMHTGLVVNEAQRWQWALGTVLDLEDLVAAGHLGIIRALETWDPEQSKFSAYALPWVRHFIRRTVTKARLVHIPQYVAKMALDKGEHLPYTVYLDEYEDNGHEGEGRHNPGPTLASPEVDMEQAIDYNSNKGELIKGLASLTAVQRDVITMHFYKEIPFTQIAINLNLSPTRVKQIYNEAMDRLREHMTGSDDGN